MSATRVRIKTKRGRGGPRLTKIKAKLKKDAYIGDDAKRLEQQLKAERARADSLQRQIDSLKCEIEIKIKIESK